VLGETSFVGRGKKIGEQVTRRSSVRRVDSSASTTTRASALLPPRSAQPTIPVGKVGSHRATTDAPPLLALDGQVGLFRVHVTSLVRESREIASHARLEQIGPGISPDALRSAYDPHPKDVIALAKPQVGLVALAENLPAAVYVRPMDRYQQFGLRGDADEQLRRAVRDGFKHAGLSPAQLTQAMEWYRDRGQHLGGDEATLAESFAEFAASKAWPDAQRDAAVGVYGQVRDEGPAAVMAPAPTAEEDAATIARAAELLRTEPEGLLARRRAPGSAVRSARAPGGRQGRAHRPGNACGRGAPNVVRCEAGCRHAPRRHRSGRPSPSRRDRGDDEGPLTQPRILAQPCNPAGIQGRAHPLERSGRRRATGRGGAGVR
jgi:hypothetical protein